MKVAYPAYVRTLFTLIGQTRTCRSLVSLAEPCFFSLPDPTCLRATTHFDADYKDTLGDAEASQVSLAELAPSLVPSRLGTKTIRSKGGIGGKLFLFSISSCETQSMDRRRGYGAGSHRRGRTQK